jgi:molecular chaperone HtpG
MEGTYEYTLLLFVPSTAPFDLWMPEARHGVKHIHAVAFQASSGRHSEHPVACDRLTN